MLANEILDLACNLDLTLAENDQVVTGSLELGDYVRRKDD
jgi:hypothetical protein